MSVFTYVIACIDALFLFMAEYRSIVHLYSIVVICSSVNGRLGGLHVLAIVNNAAVSERLPAHPCEPAGSALFSLLRGVDVLGQTANSCLKHCTPGKKVET